jgi:fermentation-respiration switch protein FrsA (DUF1100 family)
MHEFFPGNYMWSLATMRTLGCGGLVGEIARPVAALQAAAARADLDAWYAAWRDLGDHLRQQGEAERADDHPLSARESFLRACMYYQTAISFMDHADPRRADTHQQSIAAFERLAALSEPPIERVEVPYEGTSFPAWFVPAPGAAGPAPAVIFLPGLDATKEQGLAFAQALAARGFSTLLPDGPGVGEAVFLRGMVNRHDYEVPGRADFDYLASRPDVDAARIAAVGISLGGYRAPRFAAFEPRLAACVAWGAVWDWGARWARRGAGTSNNAVNTPGHVLFVMGARTADEVAERVRDWRLDGVVQQVRCPLLVVHGEKDLQVPVEEAYQVYDAAGTPQKELKVFTEAEGGAAHTQIDNRPLAHAYIVDWLDDVLVRGRRREGIVVGAERRR